MARHDYQLQLDDLRGHLDEIATLAKSMLSDGVRAFESLDRALAEEVDARKDRLADLDEDTEQLALRILALQAPMAGDLRRIGATLKLITYLTRIGRYGRDIGNVMKRWPEGKPHLFEIADLPRMADNVLEMLDLALASFHAGEAPDVERIARIEDQVDTMRRRIWDSCLVQMLSDSRSIEPCAHYMMVARYLERCGDNVCKITEKLYYAATGERILVK